MQNLVDCSNTSAVATQRPVAEASSLSASNDSHLRLIFLLCSSSVQVGQTDVIENNCLTVDPDHFDAGPDPDPTSEKTGCGSESDHALYKILKQNIFALKWPIRLIF
jgi:hypothetical protein